MTSCASTLSYSRTAPLAHGSAIWNAAYSARKAASASPVSDAAGSVWVDEVVLVAVDKENVAVGRVKAADSVGRGVHKKKHP